MTFIKDKYPMLISTAICIALVWYVFGCEPTTPSLIDPARNVNRATLEIELNTLMAMHQQRVNDIEKKNEIRQFILQQSLTIAETGTVNPIGIITSLLAIFGVGAAADDVRLRKQRKKLVTYEPIAKPE